MMNMKINKDFCIFILTHGRPDNIITVKTLKRQGYTGPYFIIIDNEDQTKDRYIKLFGNKVIIFDKEKISKTFDEFDNFNDRRSIVYARNACFDIAYKLGYEYFLQLDDDYEEFKMRINHNLEHPKDRFTFKTKLTECFYAFLDYYKSMPNVKSIAMSQGGDWFGGENNFGKIAKRKAMNTFFCSTKRRFNFIGRINEDVNTYTNVQCRGNVFFTIPFVQVDQKQTQSNKGGMTEIYLNKGTYIKSFYTIICSPNCTKINLMGRINKRLHHSINWNSAVPYIIDEKYKK